MDVVTRIFKKRHPPVGASPGTLMVQEGGAPAVLRAIRYDGDHVEELDPLDLEQIPGLRQAGRTTWIDVQGLGDEAQLRRLGELFDIHPLVLEDVVNAPQRPKAEEYPAHLVLITRMARLTTDLALDIEQVAILVGPDYVVSFQERAGDGDVLDPIRRRIRVGRGPIRRGGPGYLGYALLDTIVDAYYPVVEQLSERIERAEDSVMTRPTSALLHRLNRIKADLVIMRRALAPQRETLQLLLRERSRFLTDEVRIYLQDTLDHCAQLVDVIDSHRDLVSGLANTYLSVVANRTNEVMKMMTLMTSIFIPITFVAGVYGMNFDAMPELRHPWAYPIVLAIMGGMAMGMLLYFWRRGWLGRGSDDDDGA